MEQVTVEQVKAYVDEHNIQRYEFQVCNKCNRGIRLFFYRHQDVIKDDVYLQQGCDCAWQESKQITYEVLVEWFNNLLPDEMVFHWEQMAKQGSPRKVPLKVEEVVEELTAEEQEQRTVFEEEPVVDALSTVRHFMEHDYTAQLIETIPLEPPSPSV